MNRPRPLLVLVSGAPASGKSTLARRLAANLRLPLIAKDLIKETLFDALGTPDREGSAELSLASFRLLYAVLGQLVEADVGVVVDCNLHRGRSEAELSHLLDRSNALLIHCQTSYFEIARRYQRRVA